MLSGGATKLLVTSKEAAALLSISERTLWTRTKLGQVKAIRIGRSVRYDIDDLREFIWRSKGEQGECDGSPA